VVAVVSDVLLTVLVALMVSLVFVLVASDAVAVVGKLLFLLSTGSTVENMEYYMLLENLMNRQPHYRCITTVFILFIKELKPETLCNICS
jgi:uncharacterized membrane protein